MKLLEIEILNWREYQVRRDTKANSWFRLDHGLFDDDQFFDFSPSELCFFIYLLCIASKKNAATFVLSTEKAEQRFKRSEVEAALEKLERLRIVHVRDTSTSRARDVDVTGTIAGVTLQTDRQTDKQTETRARFDFENIYSLYPRKEGKKRGLELCARQIKTQADYDKLLGAVARYSAHLRAKGTAPEYVKQFSTFMNSWTDWSDQDAGKVRVVEPPRPQARPPEDEFIPSGPDPASAARIKAIVGGIFKPMPR